MPPAAIPSDEFERIAELRALEILDTPAEERFDVFTRIAARVAQAPIVVLSLLDVDRQWFKSRLGIEASETPREVAFCAHAILAPDRPLVVPDATRDPRFADNPLVTGAPGIRFYAGVPVKGPGGHALGTLCVIDTVPRDAPPALVATLADLARSVTEALTLHDSVRRLSHIAATDPLTGLADAASFERRHRSLDTGAATEPHALILLDIDRFQQINHLFGHAGGNAVLVQAAERLRAETGPADLVARLGGDSFGVLLRDPAGVNEAAKRLHRAFARPFAIAGQPVRVRVSLGLARCPDDAPDPARTAELADLALACAKRRGRNQTCDAATCDDDLRSRRMRRGRAGIAAALREALVPSGREPFRLVWQKVVRARTGALASLEALIRWPRAGQILIPPAEFVPVAEERGLITHLDRWVLRTACAEAAGWAKPVPIAVNVSPPNLFLADGARFIEDVLRETGLAPGRLVLEVTEGVLMHDIAGPLAAIAELRSLGVRIALDDFGAGHASLGYLRDFPFDTIKIDRELAVRAPGCRRSLALLRTVLRLAGELGATTVAEGVETEAQAEFLRGEGVDMLQGYLFGAPGAVPRGLRRCRPAHPVAVPDLPEAVTLPAC
jgi:diguanylate cyclase (GGDEF)-like protein